MAFKKYLTADNVHAQLDGNVNTTQTQIVFKNGANVPTAGNWIATLVQYGQDGFPSKWEKVYVTSVAGSILTVQRAYDGSTAQTFNDNDYVFLNVVSEIIKDIQNRIDELGTSLGDYQLTSQKNQANGYAGLGADGKIDVGQIPAIKSHEFLTVTNAAARYALTTSQVQLGDEVLETSTGETYVLIASDPSQAGSWLFKSDTTPTWSSIAAKPTTIAGFGITDAYTKTEIDASFGNYYTKTAADARFVHLTGDETIAGKKTHTGNVVVRGVSIAPYTDNPTIVYTIGANEIQVGGHNDVGRFFVYNTNGGGLFEILNDKFTFNKLALFSSNLISYGNVDLGSYNSSTTRVGGTSYDLGGAGGLEKAFQAGVWNNGGSFSPYLTIQRNGKVGIGINDPATRLNVAGFLKVTGEGGDWGTQRLLFGGDGTGCQLQIGSQNNAGTINSAAFKIWDNGSARAYGSLSSTAYYMKWGEYDRFSLNQYDAGSGARRAYFSCFDQNGNWLGNPLEFDNFANGEGTREIRFDGGGYRIRFITIPTSSAGLPSGAIWRNGTVINIVA